MDYNKIKDKRSEITKYEEHVIDTIMSNLEKTPFEVRLEEISDYPHSPGDYPHKVIISFVRQDGSRFGVLEESLMSDSRKPVERERQTIKRVIEYLTRNYSKTLFKLNNFKFSEQIEGTTIHGEYTCRFRVEND